MKTPQVIRSAAFAASMLMISTPAFAQAGSEGMLDDVLNRYKTMASAWASVFIHHASIVFWSLAAISMIWTFGQMALRRADIGEFAAELIRFVIFAGFYWWLLTNGPAIGMALINGLRSVGAEASGLPNNLAPSGIVDIGFDIFNKAIENTSAWHPIDSLVGLLTGLAILITLALVGVNMLLLLASGYILAYAGVIFLGFGGSRWTSDIAINYFKTVLAVGASLLTMVLIVGVGKTFLDQYYAQAGQSLTLQDMGIMLVFSVVLLALVNKVPAIVAGIITGGSIGAAAGIGGFGAGAAVGAASMAAAAAATGGAAIAAGAANAAGGASAVQAAFKAAQGNLDGGSSNDGKPLTSAGSVGTNGNGSDGGGGGSGGGGGGGSALAPAMGEPAGSSSTGPVNDNSGGRSAAASEATGASGASGSADGSAATAASDPPPVNEGGEAANVPASAATASAGNEPEAPASAEPLSASRAGALALAAETGRVLASNAAGMVKDAVGARVANTAGGRLAARINAASDAAKADAEPLAPATGIDPAAGAATPAASEGFTGDTISSGAAPRQTNPTPPGADDEVAEFMNRGRQS